MMHITPDQHITVADLPYNMEDFQLDEIIAILEARGKSVVGQVKSIADALPFLLLIYINEEPSEHHLEEQQTRGETNLALYEYLPQSHIPYIAPEPTEKEYNPQVQAALLQKTLQHMQELGRTIIGVAIEAKTKTTPTATIQFIQA